MIKLDLLQHQNQLQTRLNGDSTELFDPVRKKWLVLTPEETVRQLFIMHCVENGIIKDSRISVERQITVNTLTRRYDIAFHDRHGLPAMLIECKAPSVAITQSTVDQVSRYNLALRVPVIVVTNGINTYGCRIDFENESFESLSALPVIDS